MKSVTFAMVFRGRWCESRGGCHHTPLPLVDAKTEETFESDALLGKIILLDPCHQLGISNPKFAKQLAQKKFNGTTVKGCNTTGTATNSGHLSLAQTNQ